MGIEQLKCLSEHYQELVNDVRKKGRAVLKQPGKVRG